MMGDGKGGHMVTFKLMTVITMLTLVLVGPFNGMAQNSEFADADRGGVASDNSTADSEEILPEMRASIVDRDGDQFIAMTEEGQEFRLPVEGAPANVNVGDELRLIPDAETQTIQVFKAEPPQMQSDKRQDSQL
jgi:hypothetical protein